MKYWHKLLALLFFTTFALTAVLSYVTYRTTNSISDQVTSTGRTLLSRQAEDFLGEIAGEQSKILSLQLDSFRIILLNGAYFLESASKDIEDEAALNNLLVFLRNKGGSHCRKAFFRYADGRIISDRVSSSRPADPGLLPHTRKTSIQPMAQEVADHTWLLEIDEQQSSQYKEPIINVLTHISKDGQFIGDIGLSVAIQDLVAQLNQDQIIRGSYTFLMNDQQLLLAAPVNARVDLTPSQTLLSQQFIDLSKAKTNEMDTLFSQIALGQAGITQTTVRQIKKYFAYHPVENTPWRLCIAAPVVFVTAPSIRLANDVYLARNRAIKENLFLATVILLVVLFLGGWFARHMTLPLLNMTALTRIIAGGNFEHRIALRRKDEIGQLSHDFNSMSIQLQKLVSSYESQTTQLEGVNQKLKKENSERRLAEAKVRQLNADLEQRVTARTAELSVAKQQADTANEAKSEFLARMSHEIRTPLNAINGLTTIVLKSTLTNSQRDYLAKAQFASNTLMQVVNDILDFSKIEAGILELTIVPFNLDTVLAQFTDLFSDQIITKNLELILAVNPNTPRHLMGDKEHLSQVLINLIQNAIKFTDAGKITVGVEREATPPNDQGQESIKFRVSDTGIGITTGALPSLFDPFTQVEDYMEREHYGTGLGLSICQQLVELMGGRIWVETTLGQGSTFFFTVLLREQKEDTSLQQEAIVKSPPLRLTGRRVLVVEDSRLNLEVAVVLLEEVNLIVETAMNGKVACNMVMESDPGYYDAVFMDIQMPIMNGYEATRRIRAWEATLRDTDTRMPVIALTAHALKGEKEKCIAADMDDYLSKPIDESELHRLLKKWITL